MRHYTERNEYKKLNEKYSTLHLKQYLTEKEIKHLESLLEGKKEPKNNSEKDLLKLWNKDLPLIEYADRVRSSLKKVNKVIELKDDKDKVWAKVIVTPKEKSEYREDSVPVELTYWKNEDKLIVVGVGGVHLTHVDVENIKKKVEEKINA